MTHKKLHREAVLQMLFADSDTEEEYLSFGKDDRPSDNRAFPGSSLHQIQAFLFNCIFLLNIYLFV